MLRISEDVSGVRKHEMKNPWQINLNNKSYKYSSSTVTATKTMTMSKVSSHNSTHKKTHLTEAKHRKESKEVLYMYRKICKMIIAKGIERN